MTHEAHERKQALGFCETEALRVVLPLPGPDQTTWLRRWRDPEDKLFHPRTPLNGRMLQEQLGLVPGPSLGALIDHLRLEYAFGRVVNQNDALLSARDWVTKNRSML